MLEGDLETQDLRDETLRTTQGLQSPLGHPGLLEDPAQAVHPGDHPDHRIGLRPLTRGTEDTGQRRGDTIHLHAREKGHPMGLTGVNCLPEPNMANASIVETRTTI